MSKLETQSNLKDGDSLMIVYCTPGVFPVTRSRLKEQSMVVYVDRNFKDIFQFIKRESGWETVDEGVAKFTEGEPSGNRLKLGRSAEVSGPPGSGKNITTTYFSFDREFSSFRQINGSLCGIEVSVYKVR